MPAEIQKLFLRNRIRKFFRGVIYPGSELIYDGKEDLMGEMEGFISDGYWHNKSWKEIPDSLIILNDTALLFCSPQSYQWLIPAYMSFSLKFGSEKHLSFDHTIYSITCSYMQNIDVNSSEYVSFVEKTKKTRSCLTKPQKFLLRDFLLVILGHDALDDDEVELVKTAIDRKYYLL